MALLFSTTRGFDKLGLTAQIFRYTLVIWQKACQRVELQVEQYVAHQVSQVRILPRALKSAFYFGEKKESMLRNHENVIRVGCK